MNALGTNLTDNFSHQNNTSNLKRGPGARPIPSYFHPEGAPDLGAVGLGGGGWGKERYWQWRASLLHLFIEPNK